MRRSVTVAIPGAGNAEQARANTAAADVPALDAQVMEELSAVYASDIRPYVHPRW
jgi:aryl-alcohol dehydrogenase-like predicted oxidoreductase